MTELKPCPFCGAREDDVDEPLHVWWCQELDGEYQVECERCGANTGLRNRYIREEAIEAWNRRVDDD